MPEDSDIVKHVLNGDVDSFRILVERYQRPVLSMIRRLIWDSHRCEEIGRDVFVAAFQKLSTFDPARSKFSTWLFTIARNMSINALKKKVPIPVEHLPEILDSRNPSDEFSDKELFAQMDQTLKALPGKLQRAFILAEFEQMPYEEIARIEGTRLGTVNRWYVYVLLLLIGTGGCLAYALHVREQLIQPFKVPSASMYPTILPKDRIIAVKNAYQTADPQRGDIVLFVYPDDRRILYIKRVVALAGDTVEVKSGNLYVNGAELPREAIGPATINSGNTASTGEVFSENNHGAKYRIFISPEKPAADFGPLTVPKYDCFVMGDNRNDSRDSRSFGPLAVTSLKGKFEYRYWPVTGGAHWGTIQ